MIGQKKKDVPSFLDKLQAKGKGEEKKKRNDEKGQMLDVMQLRHLIQPRNRVPRQPLCRQTQI